MRAQAAPRARPISAALGRKRRGETGARARPRQGRSLPFTGPGGVGVYRAAPDLGCRQEARREGGGAPLPPGASQTWANVALSPGGAVRLPRFGSAGERLNFPSRVPRGPIPGRAGLRLTSWGRGNGEGKPSHGPKCRLHPTAAPHSH